MIQAFLGAPFFVWLGLFQLLLIVGMIATMIARPVVPPALHKVMAVVLLVSVGVHSVAALRYIGIL